MAKFEIIQTRRRVFKLEYCNIKPLNSNFKFQISNLQKGFSLIEILVSVGILAVLIMVIGSFVFEIKYAGYKVKADAAALENAQRVMDTITYEMRGAESVYTPTTSANQLALETTRYLPSGETVTFIDFFLCGTAVCLKKESQSPFALTPDTVEISALQFTSVVNGNMSSVKIDLTVNSKNPTNEVNKGALVNLSSTVSLRSY